MVMSYGTVYSGAGGPVRRNQKRAYSIKRLGYKRWMVYQIGTDTIVGILPSRLRAYYVATVLSGIDVSNVFYFGDNL